MRKTTLSEQPINDLTPSCSLPAWPPQVRLVQCGSMHEDSLRNACQREADKIVTKLIGNLTVPFANSNPKLCIC